MAFIFGLRNSFTLALCLFVLCFYQLHAQKNVFDLTKYGGVASETFDNSKALVSAWKDACEWQGGGEAQLVIPSGNYFLTPTVLSGPCKSPIKFNNMGQLLSPPGPTEISHWITFRYLDGLTISGGLYNGQGQNIWDRPDVVNRGYALLSLAFVNNTNIEHVNLQNSKKTHFALFACYNIQITGMTISAPDESPNTDGIKIGLSDTIRVTDSNIASGDDCFAILTGTKNLNITGVRCGPGHGISIGGMGYNEGDEVKNIFVRNCTLTRTLNGVRIKTAANNYKGICSGVSFVDIIMEETYNPIIIDQNYCPANNCPKGDSHVQIENVRFADIRGTSLTDAAIKLECSGSNPCKDVTLDNIDITYKVANGNPATSICTNVKGSATRVKNPGTCSTLK